MGGLGLQIVWVLCSCLGTASLEPQMPGQVGDVPDAVRQRLGLSEFYQKFLDAKGFAILSSERVSDFALLEAREIIDSMIGEKENIRRALIDAGFRCAIMACDEFTTDIPEHSDLEPKDFWDRRARGLGPTVHRPAISGAEENLLEFPGDPYFQENILVHEFAHAIHEALRLAEPDFDERLKAEYEKAMKEGLWKDKYAATNRYEYFAECVQSYFGDNRENDSSHNHVNTREELFAYDKDVAVLIDETFGGNPWQYVRPSKREDAEHLEGFVLKPNQRFEWPAHLVDALEKKEAGASIEHASRDIEGWTVQVDIQLLEGLGEEFGRRVLDVLGAKLWEISVVVPEDKLTALRKVTIFLDREHPSLSSMQYHPSVEWLREHGHDTAMAKCVHIPRARSLVTAHSINEQPFAVLHELAHAYHHQVLGFDHSKIRKGYETFRRALRGKDVLHISGAKREHYALTNPKEFFAEMTEAYFGVNDFYPFVRGELKKSYPKTYKLMASIWGQ